MNNHLIILVPHCCLFCGCSSRKKKWWSMVYTKNDSSNKKVSFALSPKIQITPFLVLPISSNPASVPICLSICTFSSKLQALSQCPFSTVASQFFQVLPPWIMQESYKSLCDPRWEHLKTAEEMPGYPIEPLQVCHHALRAPWHTVWEPPPLQMSTVHIYCFIRHTHIASMHFPTS